MFTTPTLTVNLAAIVANWRTLAQQFNGRECAAVVKANAYGLGATEVTRALSAAGCHTFFVATLGEAIALREQFRDVRILVFHGVQAGEEFAFISHRLIPVLNSRAQIARWVVVARDDAHAVSALHIDTAMARLGLQPEEFFALLGEQPNILKDARVSLLMSHLACAPEPAHASNAAQQTLFQHIHEQAGDIPASLCNSGGIFLPAAFHYDLARPGCSLYGIRPQDTAPNPMQHVAQWDAPILQIRTLDSAQAVGYGATQTLQAGSVVATVASGYADGYQRALSHKAVAYAGDVCVQLAGRVTMDMLCFDISNVPPAQREGLHSLTLLGDRDGIRVDDLAARAGTIGYEIFTGIGARVARVYTE
jgi:alanine racemase